MRRIAYRNASSGSCWIEPGVDISQFERRIDEVRFAAETLGLVERDVASPTSAVSLSVRAASLMRCRRYVT